MSSALSTAEALLERWRRDKGAVGNLANVLRASNMASAEESWIGLAHTERSDRRVARDHMLSFPHHVQVLVTNIGDGN
jgi:hypothetical protein